MTKPFELVISDYYPDKYVVLYKYEDPEDRMLDFIQGSELDLSFDYHLKYEAKCFMRELLKYDYVWATSFLDILLSPKAMDVLQEICPEQFQTFETVISCKDGDIKEYKAINILNYYDVSDPEKSRLSKVAGYKANGFVIKDQPMEPLHIARDKKFPPKIIISATLKEALEKAKIRGCRYWPGDEPKD